MGVQQRQLQICSRVFSRHLLYFATPECLSAFYDGKKQQNQFSNLLECHPRHSASLPMVFFVHLFSWHRSAEESTTIPKPRVLAFARSHPEVLTDR